MDQVNFLPLEDEEDLQVIPSKELTRQLQIVSKGRERTKKFPCDACWKIPVAQAKIKYDCWTEAKCYRRRNDAKNRDKRAQEYRDRRITEIVEQIEHIQTPERCWLDAVLIDRALGAIKRRGQVWLDSKEMTSQDLQALMDRLGAMVMTLQSPENPWAEDTSDKAEILRALRRREEQIVQGEIPKNHKLHKYGLQVSGIIYTSNGGKTGVLHGAELEIRSAQILIDRQGKHFQGMPAKHIAKWFEDTLYEFKIPRLQRTDFKHERYCQIAGCTLHKDPAADS